MTTNGRLLLVGCGKMGGAMLEGWLASGTAPDDVVVIEPGAGQAAAIARLGVRTVAATDEVPADFRPDIVILAVKPQVMDGVVAGLVAHAGHACFLSIAAGKRINGFETILGSGTAIVRAMPNTPAAIKRGMIVLTANAHADAGQRAAAERLCAAVGDIVWIEDEELMDAVTALSGSGPAYVFHLVECMAKAGEAAGLPAEVAMQLARTTVSGAGELLRQSPEEASTLRRNVTSPGGTTAAALDVLMAEDGLAPLMTAAITAAAKRSRELA